MIGGYDFGEDDNDPCDIGRQGTKLYALKINKANGRRFKCVTRGTTMDKPEQERRPRIIQFYWTIMAKREI